MLTSDHGEMFERGTWGHLTKLMYDPVLRIPLLIFDPERRTRLDVYGRTSAIDLLPTLLHSNGYSIPKWLDGDILPPFQNPMNKNIYAFHSRYAEKDQAITEGSATLIQDQYKLIVYFGYKEITREGMLIELYDVENDPDELIDISSINNEIADKMLAEVMSNFTNGYQRLID